MKAAYYLLLLSSVSLAAVKKTVVVQPTIFDQIIGAGSCMLGCGPIAILFIILPVVAVYVWKKLFSIG
jgi:hypothetical protein